MAHMMKFNKADLSNMLGHYERTHACDKNGERGNIDPERTEQNYNLTFRDDNMTDREFIEHRLSELTYREQKNNVVMATWCITVPRDFHGDREEFFSCCASFCAERYGQENIINGYVHRDEPGARDHMHLAFIPVRERDGVERLCSNVVSKKDLATFHEDLERYLERERCPAHMLTGETKSKDMQIDLYKYRDEFMEREFAYQIKQDPTFFARMDTYVDRQMELDRDVRVADRDAERDREIDRDREVEREHEHTKA